MSVTTLIRHPEIRAVLDPFVDELEYREFRAGPMRVDASCTDRSRMGTAFDYALRLELMRVAPQAKSNRWVAESAAEILHARALEGNAQAVRVAKRALTRVKNARIFARKYRRASTVDDDSLRRLCDHALKLARLDPAYRAAYLGPDLVGRNTEEDIEELRQLLRLTPIAALCGTSVHLNPNFGELSTTVGGADADLLVDNRLIDLKTRSKERLTRDDIRQLLFYVMLANASHLGLNGPIDTIQIYLSRHGSLATFPLGRSMKRLLRETGVLLEIARRAQASASWATLAA